MSDVIVIVTSVFKTVVFLQYNTIQYNTVIYNALKVEDRIWGAEDRITWIFAVLLFWIAF